MQEEPRQTKIINEWNDSPGTLLQYLVGVLLQQHCVVLLTVFDVGFFVDERSPKIGFGRCPDLPGT